MAADFIPDNQFVADPATVPNGDETVQNVPSAPRNVAQSPPNFVSDSAFVPDDEKYGTAGQQVISGLEGLARGVTLGGSDVLETGLGVPAADIKGRRDTNPVTSTATQIGGGAGLIALTGGLAAPVETALGGGALAHAAGFAVEGAGFGAGNAVSDAALGDSKLTGQKILANAGMGAALGAGLGLLSKGVSTFLPAATKKLASSLGNLKEGIFGTEENPSLLSRALSVPGGIASGQNPSDWALAFNQGLNAEHPAISIRSLTKNLGDIHDAAKVAAEDLFKASEIEPAVTTKLTPLSSLEETAAPSAETSGDAAESLTNAGENYEAALKNFQSSFMKKEAGAGGQKRFTIDPTKIQSFFTRFNDPSQDLRKQYLNNFLNSASEIASASENYHGYKAAESSIADHISELAKQNEDLGQVAAAISKNKSMPAANRIGEVGAAMGAHALGIPSPVVGAALGVIEAYKAIKNPYQFGSTLSNSFEKLKVLGDISQSVGEKISSLAKGVFSNTERAVPEGVPELGMGKGYDKRVERIQALASDPQALMDHLTKTTDSLYQAAPNVSQSLHAGIISAVQFLNSKIPKPMNEMALSVGWEPSKTQKAEFQRYYAAVDDPLSVFKEVKNGTLSHESLEALSVVHPELLQEMRKSVLENLNLKKAKNLPFSVKISLSKFLGEPLSEGLTLPAIAANQAAFLGPQQSKLAPKRTTHTTLGGLKELSFADRAATAVQNTERREREDE